MVAGSEGGLTDGRQRFLKNLRWRSGNGSENVSVQEVVDRLYLCR